MTATPTHDYCLHGFPDFGAACPYCRRQRRRVGHTIRVTLVVLALLFTADVARGAGVPRPPTFGPPPGWAPELAGLPGWARRLEAVGL